MKSFFKSIRKDTYMKKHQPHTWLVFGYDTDKKTCSIIEHKHKDSLSYEKRTISFDDVINAHNGYQEHFGVFMNVNADYYEFYTLDSSNIKKDIVEAQCDMDFNKYRKNIITQKACIKESLEVLKEFEKDFEIIVTNRSILDKNIADIVAGLTDIINSKQVEKYKIALSEKPDSLVIKKIDQIMENWIFIRAVVVKYMYSADYIKDSFLEAKNMISEIYIDEKNFYTEIENLQSQIH